MNGNQQILQTQVVPASVIAAPVCTAPGPGEILSTQVAAGAVMHTLFEMNPTDGVYYFNQSVLAAAGIATFNGLDSNASFITRVGSELPFGLASNVIVTL